MTETSCCLPPARGALKSRGNTGSVRRAAELQRSPPTLTHPGSALSARAQRKRVCRARVWWS